MKYTWDRRRLISLFINSNSRRDLFDMLKASRKNMTGDNRDIFSTLEDDLNTLKSMPKLPYFIETVLSENIKKNDVYTPDEDIYSKEDALYITKEYYKTLGNSLYNTFLSIYNDKNHNLRLENDIPSKTFICPSNDEIYIQVGFNGSIHSIVDLVHEYSHAIGYSLLPYETRNSVNDYFIEVESSFHTLIFLDYLEQTLGNDDEVENERNIIRNDIIEDTNFIKEKYIFLALYEAYRNANEKVDPEILKQYIKDYMNITDEKYDKLLKTSISSILPYLIGNYIGIELYYKYKKDPKLGIFLYILISKITASSCEDFFNQILALDIYPGKNVSTYTKNIKARV